MTVHELLALMVEHDASDIYLTVGAPPTYRIDGRARRAGQTALQQAHLEQLLGEMLSGAQQQEYARELELNFALCYADIGRFRVNVLRQRGCPAIVIRRIRAKILTLEELGLPSTLADIMRAKRGLVLVVGSTGSGKSTSLAAMIDYWNSTYEGHIVTIEDPVEFVHPHKKAVVTQREVGVDTHSFGAALKNALRQAPDVILVGEIRDEETMEAAVSFAETGHLCLGTLHANNANQAMERVLNFFPVARHPQILLQLSLNLRAVLSQRLVPTVDGGRTAALEILRNTPRVGDLIKRGEVELLKGAMETGRADGMQSFDDALHELYLGGRVDEDTALAFADSANDLRLRIKMGTMGSGAVAAELAGSVPRADAAHFSFDLA